MNKSTSSWNVIGGEMYIHSDDNRRLFNRALGQQLKAELAVHDIPNDRVAERLGIHRGTLYKYMRSENSVPADFVYGFCRVIQLDPLIFQRRVLERLESLK